MRLNVALEVLKLHASILDPIVRARTPEDARSLWEAALPGIRKAYKARAFATHPDRGGQGGVFRLVTEAYELLKHPEFATRIWHEVRQPPVRIVRVVSTPGFTSSTSTSNTTGGWDSGIFGLHVPYFVKRSL